MGRGGKPRHKFSAEEIDELRTLSMIALPKKHMAAELGLSETWLDNLLKKDNAAQLGMAQGRAKASKKAIGTLFNLAVGVMNPDGKTYKIPPDLSALKFWLQTQEGFRTTDRVELTGAHGGPIMTAQLSDEEREAEIARLMKMRQLTDDE